MNGEHQPHDAQKTPADMKDHLARHDKPIACGGRIARSGGWLGCRKNTDIYTGRPDLTALNKDGADLADIDAKAWNSTEAHCEEAGRGLPEGRSPYAGHALQASCKVDPGSSAWSGYGRSSLNSDWIAFIAGRNVLIK